MLGPLSEASGFTNGAVGGDRGWAAALATFRLAVETVLEDGTKIKTRKPKDRTAANIRVIGLVRRIDLGRAMMKAGQMAFRSCEKVHLEWPNCSLVPYLGQTEGWRALRLDWPSDCQSVMLKRS